MAVYFLRVLKCVALYVVEQTPNWFWSLNVFDIVEYFDYRHVVASV